MENIIVFGGTFDPIHNGHLEIAKHVHNNLKLDINFVPIGLPPYKPPPLATYNHRINMLKLALKVNIHFKINELEKNEKEYSFTYITIDKLNKQYKSKANIFFIIGMDSLMTFETWHEWEYLISMCNFLVFKRHGYEISNVPNIVKEKISINNGVPNFKKHHTNNFYILDYYPSNISSTQIKQQIRNRKNISNLVPKEVEDYIVTNNLYR